MTVWEDLVGQEHALAALRAAAVDARRVATGEGATDGSMTHAWLFVGPPGSGRSVAARAFAAALQCTDVGEPGCGACAGCRTALAGSHADVDVVVPEGLHLRIDEARGIVRRSARSPSQGRWQVTLIEDADRMEERTSNTLLKAVEEPPPRGVLLLCAPTPEELLPTIRSRARLVALRIPSTRAIADILTGRDGVHAELAAFAARATQGHVGRARRLATDAEAQRRRREVLTLPRSLRTVAGCFEAAAAFVAAAGEEAEQITAPVERAETAALTEALGGGLEKGKGKARAAAPRGSGAALKDLERRQKSRGTRTQRDALDRALVDLAAFYRDVLTVQLAASVDLVHADLAESVRALAGASTPAATVRRVDAVLACRRAIDANVAPLLAVEAMALSLHQG